MTAFGNGSVLQGGSLGRRGFLGVLLSAVATSSLGQVVHAAGPTPNRPPPDAPYRNRRLPVEQRVDDLLARMTVEEKVAQMQGIWLQKGTIQEPNGDFSVTKATARFPHGLGQISRPSDFRGVDPAASTAAGAVDGSVNRDGRQTALYVNAAQQWAVEGTRLGIPLMMHEEALHGFTARGATSFPQAIALASTWDTDLVREVYSVAAKEMRLRGAHLALAPVVDVARDPRWGRIEECFGEDPHLVAEMGLASIRGFQGETLPLAKDKVLVTLKHMTGHGQPENGTNVGPANISERTLRENFFPPFERAVKELPVLSVMASYNEIDGVPSHASRFLLHDVLRVEWGFKGAVVSDYFAIRELNSRHRMFATIEDAAIRALEAGVDIELPDGEGYPALPALLTAGRVSMAQLDDAVRRLLTMKMLAGLFEAPFVDPDAADPGTATPAAVALARRAAGRAITLLSNPGNALPLDPAKLKRIAVIGTHAVDTPIGGYSDVPRKVVSVLDGIRSAVAGKVTVDYAEGYRLTKSRSWTADAVDLVEPSVNAALRPAALAAARRADAVIMVMGENEQLSREAWADNHLGDRASLDLVGPQMAVFRDIHALGKPVIVVMLNGRPLAIGDVVEKAAAVLEGWYLGQETGHGVADVLFGAVNPGGKLPVSFARHVGQLPVFYNHKPTSRRGYLFEPATPLFAFGHGLSYTTFELSAPRLSSETIAIGQPVSVEVDVTNTGSRAGDEVVQIYVRDDHASVTRPVKELKAFKRITLAPGARQTVRLTLGADAFSLWDMSMRRVVEPGTFTIMAGSNSVDVKTVTLTVR